jgi:transcriptional regulator with XRE-family HTH domain
MEKHLKAYLAGQLRTYRRNAGLTQDNLASKIGRTAEAISNIERGKSLPTLETIVAISDALELPLREFFPGESFDGTVSQNRLKAEAEAMSLLRDLSDSRLQVAIAQIRALGEL